MIPCNRRDFLKHTLAGTGLALTASAWPGLAAETTAPLACKGDDLVPLGRTGIQVSRLAQGTGYNGWARQSDHTRLGKAGFDRLARHSLERGIRFFDMADLYGTHPFVRDVIKDLPRDRVVLLSKIWVRKEDWVTPSGGAVAEVDRFCQELGTDHLDVCLMHCMTDDKWADQFEHVRDELTTLKQKGRVRAVGVSCHDLGALQLAATHPWVDVIFARINYKGGKDYSMDGTAQEIATTLKLARKSGKAVVGMKIFGAGKLIEPEQKDTSLKFVFAHGLVDAITIGMKKPEEVDDTLTRMSQVKV